MGYELRIIRPEQATPITLSEWLGVVETDAEMQREGVANAETAAGTVRYENPGLVKWKNTWFDFRRGKIFVKNPNAEDILKMKQLAAKLNAKVTGDEGEEY